MNNWAETYIKFMHDIFGTYVPCDLRNTKLHSIYPENSKYFQRCFNELLKVELEFAQDLIIDIRQRNIPGAFVEFGIFQGAWVQRLYEMTEQAGLRDREIWGFDSFKGLSAPHINHDSSFWKEGMYTASRAEVEKNLNLRKRPRIKLVEGFFSDSLHTSVATSIGKIAYARIDCDIYEPALECLNYLSQRLTHNAILVFDDWTHDIAYGEAKAFAEWIPNVPHLHFEFLCLGPWDHLYLRVLHK